MKKLFIFIAFAAGYLIMSLELLGFRLLAPYFGNSIYVWGSLIGLILAALAGGYYLGGWLADNKKADLGLLAKLFSAAVLFLLADLFFYLPVLKELAGGSVIWGALAATLAIFFAPMVILAAISPVVIKILSAREKIGQAAGLVYAWGTAGSILGTFLTSFVFIPYFGSRLTFWSCFFLALIVLAVLLLVSGNERKRIFWAVLFFLISLAAWHSPILPKNVILETESVYNRIRLIDKEGKLLLTLNSQRDSLVHSGYSSPSSNNSWLYLGGLFGVGPLIKPVNSLLVLGMAAGSTILQHQVFSPQIKIEAVEIDPRIIEIAKGKFGLKESESLKIFQDDARPFLARSKKQYDMIEIDLFQGSPFIPFYVLTREFFQSVFSHLNSQGLMMMNIYAPGQQEILAPILATMNSVFPAVYTIPIDNNFMVLATRSETNLKEIKNQIKNAKLEARPDLRLVIDYALDFIQEYQPNQKSPVFTDDWAPVETITYQMLKGIRY